MFIRRKVKLRVKRVIISQRRGIRRTLIHKCTRAMKQKKNPHRETMAVNLANRMAHLPKNLPQRARLLNLEGHQAVRERVRYRCFQSGFRFSRNARTPSSTSSVRSSSSQYRSSDRLSASENPL